MELVLAEAFLYALIGAGIIVVAIALAIIFVLIFALGAICFSLERVYKSALIWEHAPYRNTFRLLCSAFGIGCGVFVGVWKGMVLGAFIGSLVPGIGTVAGAITGGIIGGILITGIVGLSATFCAKQITRYITYRANKNNPDAISKTNPLKYQLSEQQKEDFSKKGIKLLEVKEQLTHCRELKNHPTAWGDKYREKRQLFHDIFCDLKVADKYDDAVQKLSENTPNEDLMDEDGKYLEISKPW